MESSVQSDANHERWKEMTGKGRIAIFTEFYPYGKGEEFLENEIKVAEHYYEKITIISFNKNTKAVTKYVPNNATIIPLRQVISEKQLLIKRLLSVFTIDVWRQTALCIKERGWKSGVSGIKNAVMEHSLISVLRMNEHKWAKMYDVYYSYWLSGLASYLALRKKQLGGIIISRAHGYDCFFDRGFHAHRNEQFMLLDAIFPICEIGKADLIDQGCIPDKLHVSRLGVVKPCNQMNPYNDSKQKIIVSCSNVVELKRLDLLIEALSLIEDLNIHWIHFGDGTSMSRILGLSEMMLKEKDNIDYDFKGWRDPSDIHNFYQNNPVDFFINCSDVEGVPVSIMEAMSYGIPCIARRVGGNEEIVKDSNGILLPSKCSPFELKTAIEAALNMPEEELSLLRQGAFNTFTQKYDANLNYNTFFRNMVTRYNGNIK